MAQDGYLHDHDLQPTIHQVPGMGDEGLLLSIDACIQLARDGISPKAKRMYRMYLKHRRVMQRAGMSGKSMRTEAFYRAMEESGVQIVERMIGGMHVGGIVKDA